MAVENIKDDQFESAIAGEKVIVKFYADWCGSCKLFAPKYKRLSNDDRFSDVSFIEVNAEENPNARKHAGVDNLPFFATYSKGQLQSGSAGSKEEMVVSMLEKL